MSDQMRCMATQGTAFTGPLYCGNRAKTVDVNGRPVCGVHRKGQPRIPWFGDQGRYPEGTGGTWKWVRGEFR